MIRFVPKATLCSTLAIATALLAAPRPAAAQFVGTVISETGAHAHVLGGGQLQINVTSPQAVINWSATGAASGGIVTFQQSGAVAEFQGNGAFAVLNRVYPVALGSGILLDGIINTSSGGGTVFFYSPNGVVIGQHAAINVGSLGLTTLPITNDADGNWLSTNVAGDVTMAFGAAGNPNSYIRVDPGATLAVSGAGNYIALVAPKVDVQGTIKTDGVAALVAAEQATLTIRESGLWDIQVDTGTTDAQGVYLSGAITRNAAGATAGSTRRAYIVSVSKNDAMTMLFGAGSQLGFDVAGSAGVENNAVVLSAGNNISGGAPVTGEAGGSNLQLDGVTVTSDLYASADHDVSLTSNGGASLFTGNVNLSAPGTINVQATSNNVTFQKALNATTDVKGDSGQNATAGDINVQAFNGKTLSAKTMTLNANGTGGDAAGDGLAGGTGTGGHILIQANSGGTVSTTGALTAFAGGTGGTQWGHGGAGGIGKGGEIRVLANGGNSHVAIGGFSDIEANGQGGTYGECSGCNVSGGYGEGGYIAINGATGSGNTLTFKLLNMIAFGTGGAGDGVNGGGDGKGGQAYLGSADGAVLTLTGNYYNFADGEGGNGLGGASGGDGYGGTAAIIGFGASGGGQINLNGLGDQFVTAEGFGGNGGSSGGTGTGGTAYVDTANRTSVNIAKTLYVRTDARGGNASGGTGGNATAGNATVTATGAGTSINVGNALIFHSYGIGGDGLSGGSGTGSSSQLNFAGGNVTVSGTTTLDAYGKGGTASGAGGLGGSGNGGTARISGSSGAGNFTGAVVLNAYGTGGAATNGTGGNALGGSAFVQTDGAALHAFSTLSMLNWSSGGNGLTGGNAIALTPTAATNILDANGGGTVQVDGATLLNSNSTGGNGSAGNGGAARAGVALVTVGNRSSNGTVTLAGLTINANASGGSGRSNGGAGGNAIGGRAIVRTSDTASGINRIVTGAASLNATALGGNGGTGAAGAMGGNGGNATGGRAIARATAGNGQLVMQSIAANISATGGNGGTGGTGSVGGVGGVGGNAGDGIISIGMIPGTGSPTAAASAQFGSIIATAKLTGGNGGNGGVSYSVANGSGGRGGNAGTNFSELIADSSAVTVTGNAAFTANSSGGNGGTGGIVNGGGGNALTNDIWVTARRAAVLPGSPALLTVGGALTVVSTAIGGNGSTPGASLASGGTGVFVENAGMHLGSFAAAITSSTGYDPYSNPDLTQIINGTVTIDGSYRVNDSNRYAVHIDNGALNAGSVSLTAYNFLFDVLSPMAINRGTITAGTITINSQHDIILDANLVSLGSLDLNANGLIDLGDLNANGHISAYAGSTITLANVNSGSWTYLQAGDSVSANNVNAGGDFEVQAQLGDITLNDLTAGNDIHLRAGGDISTHDALADGRLHFDADGTVHARNLTAGRRMDINGGLGVVLGDLSAGFLYPDVEPEQGFSVVVSSGTSIVIGNVAAQDSIGFLTPGNLGTGTLTAGRDVLAMVGGDINTGAINATGRIFLTDLSSFFLAGGTEGEGDNFQSALVFANDPVLTGGSITVNGTISGGSLQAAAGGNFTSGAINVDGLAYVRSGGAVSIPTIDAGGRVDIGAAGNIGIGAIGAGTDIDVYSDLGSITLAGLTAGANIFLDAGSNITFNDASAGDSMDFQAGGSLTGGNLTAGRQINGNIQGALVLGNLSAGQDGPVGPTDEGFSVGMRSGTSIHVGDVWGAEAIGFVTPGTLIAGTLTAGTDVGLLVTGDMTIDAIHAGQHGRIYLADSSMFTYYGGGTDDFNPELLLAAEPVRTHGSITVNGTISGGSLQAKAGNNFTSGAIGVGGLASIDTEGSVFLDGVDAGGDLRIVADGTVNADNLDAGESIDIDAGGAVTALNLTAGDTVAILSGGSILLGNVSAGLIDASTTEGAEYNIALNAGGTLTTGTLAAANSIGLAATGNITTLSVNAGDAFLALGGGNMSFGPLTAGGTAYLANHSMMALGGEIAGSFDPAPIFASLPVASGGSILINGDINVGSFVGNAGTSFTSGALTTDAALQVLAGTAITTGAIDVGAAVELAAGDVEHVTSGSILTGDIFAGGSILIGAGESIGAGDLTAGNGVTLISGGAIKVGDVTAGIPLSLAFSQVFEGAAYDIAINSGGAVTTDDLNASHDVLLASHGALTTGAIDAGNAVVALGDGTMALGPINALALLYIGGEAIMESAGQIGSDFSLAALDLGQANASGGTVTINGDVTAGNVSAYSSGAFTGGDVTTDAEMFIGSASSVLLGDLTAGGYVNVAANGGSATAGGVNSGSYIRINANTTIGTQALTAAYGVDLAAGTGITVAGATDAGGDVTMTSTSGPISVQAIRADQTIDIDTAGTVTGTTMSAGDSISVWGGDGVTLTNLDAGIVSPYFSEGPGDYTIGIGSDHNVTLGNVHAGGNVGLGVGGNLLVNSIQSGGSVLAMIGGDGGFGAVSATGRFAITGFGMIAAAGGRGDFDRQFVFDAIDSGDATSAGGSINLAGPTSASRVDLLVGQTLTSGAITAQNIAAKVGGTASIQGAWNASGSSGSSVFLQSNDIAIGAGGSIVAPHVTLVSSNANQAVVGGGLNGGGYLLDGAEFGRITAGSFEFYANPLASSAIDLAIGDLTLTGSSGEGQKTYSFAVGSPGDYSGVMRVVGDVIGSNFSSTDGVRFGAGRIEVDAATATIALANSQGGLGGYIAFVTPHLHVAEGAILDKLAADSTYPNRDLALQTAPTTARPDGVIRASEIDVVLSAGGQQAAAVTTAAVASPYTILVQNMGGPDRSGFLANTVEVMGTQGLPAGSVDLVANGQLVVDGKPVTGADVRDALTADTDLTPYSSTSTINGCAMTGGACRDIPPPPPPPPTYDPGPPLASEFVLFSEPGIDDLPFGNEESIEDNKEDGGDDSASSPILAPQPLFDTRPMEDDDETDEPISGGGNPALIGAGVIAPQGEK